MLLRRVRELVGAIFHGNYFVDVIFRWSDATASMAANASQIFLAMSAGFL